MSIVVGSDLIWQGIDELYLLIKVGNLKIKRTYALANMYSRSRYLHSMSITASALGAAYIHMIDLGHRVSMHHVRSRSVSFLFPAPWTLRATHTKQLYLSS
jgi:hypothetical protein